MNASLCTPCAAMVVPEVQAVKLAGKRKKEICACCRRKRSRMSMPSITSSSGGRSRSSAAPRMEARTVETVDR